MVFEKVTHVIFDLDGLLIESESIYEQISKEIANEYGKDYTRQLKIKVMGTTEPETARLIVTELQLPLSPQEFLVKYERKVKEKLQHPRLMPGAKELVEHLHRCGIPIAVATSSREDLMEMKMQFHQDLYKMFNHFVCGSSDPEVKNGKPSPDIYLVCASRFPDKPDPSKCLAFEDAANGVKSAVGAGMQVVMVPDPDTPEEKRKSATLVLESLTEFKPEQFGLPAMT
ncbi:probable pseudouridine-5'-phosphatase [Leptinotarsa decemlineata]|uniref:probable pseudouridine-5'-phosphatase n=1 Tax=Leptinotarsa decemlineata TaxID=7539 RepID=UPI000C255465|nr:probable pseudouridine-5'-phosphatase [Leptinotarsa decemlineata]